MKTVELDLQRDTYVHVLTEGEGLNEEHGVAQLFGILERY